MQRRHTYTRLHTHTPDNIHCCYVPPPPTPLLLLYYYYLLCTTAAAAATALRPWPPRIFSTPGEQGTHHLSLSLSPSIASPPDFAPRRPLVYLASPFSLPRGRWTRVAALDGRLHSLCGQQAVGCRCIFCEDSIPRSSVQLSARCYGKGERERSLASPSA